MSAKVLIRSAFENSVGSIVTATVMAHLKPQFAAIAWVTALGTTVAKTYFDLWNYERQQKSANHGDSAIKDISPRP